MTFAGKVGLITGAGSGIGRDAWHVRQRRIHRGVEGRLPARAGAPDDVAKAMLFLASEDAGFITGIALPVDGGRTVV